MAVQKIQIRQVGAARSESGVYPAAKPQTIAGNADVVSAHFEFQHFAHQLDAIAIGLQKADVRVAVDGEIGFVELGD